MTIAPGGNIIWQYWETRGEKPRFIDDLHEIARRNSGVKIILVTPETLRDYLPDVEDEIFRIEEIAHKADMIRTRLVCRYGGMWLDSDAVVLSDLNWLFDHLKDHEFVGFNDGGSLQRERPYVRSAVFCRARTERVINHWVEAQRRKLSKTVFRWSEIGAELLNVGCLKNRDSVKILPFENICPIAAQQVEEFMTANDARAAQILTDCYVVMVSNKSAQLKNLPLFQMSAEEIAAKDFVLSRIVQRALDMAERRRVPESLNGRDANIRANRQKWDRDHPWPEDGDEWKGLAVDCKIPYAEWKRSLIDTLIVPHVTSDMHVLEIAPGHGRWTETLLARAREVTAVDLSRNCLDHCRQRFLGRNIAFFLTDGASLPPELTASIDFLWSYDAFVHMAPAIVEAYLHEIARVLKPGARAIVHHSGVENPDAHEQRDSHGWRSAVNAAMVRGFAQSAGLKVLSQITFWDEARGIGTPRHNDKITTLQKA